MNLELLLKALIHERQGERDLAETLNVDVARVTEACQTLEHAGLLQLIENNDVSGPWWEPTPSDLDGLRKKARDANLDLSTPLTE